MEKSKQVPLISLFLILFASLGLATVTSVTWQRYYTFTVTGATAAATPNFQAYSNSGCTTPIASGGTQDFGSYAPGSELSRREFYVKDANGVGGTIHALASISGEGFGSTANIRHIHSDGTGHLLENHAIGATECLRVWVTAILPATAPPGPKILNVTIGRG